MLQQLGGLWRWLQEQSLTLRVVLFAVPVVVVALLVLGGLMVWSVARPTVTPTPTVVAATQPNPPATPVVEGTVIVIATATILTPPSPQATPAVLAPGRDGSPAPISSPTQTPTPEPTSTPTPEPARSARIANTEGQGANMRRAPSVSAQRVKVIPEGNIVELVGGEQRGDGFTWRNVRDVDGSTGFVTVEFLQEIQGAPGAPPVLPPPSIQVEEITSPAVRGKEATLTIVTRPGVRCELRVLVFGPSERPTDGLGPQTADADGFCSWTWTVPEDVLPGVWRYVISAGEGESRATREVSIVVS